MYFVFSKLLYIFILPLTWAVAFLIAALIAKTPKRKRLYLIIGVMVLLVFSNPFLYKYFAVTWDVQSAPLTNTKPYSCAIVLGGFSGEDAHGHGFFNSSSDRFIQGVKLYTTGKVSHILISSGSGFLVHDNFREADWVKTQLQALNIPDSAILIENQSRNTIENAAFSKKVIDQYHLQPPYVLVTSAFHMRRALGIFKRAKLDVVPLSCNVIEQQGSLSLSDFLPDGAILGAWNIYIKEPIGTLVNSFK